MENVSSRIGVARKRWLVAASMLSVAALFPLSVWAQEQQLNVTANGDGSCTYHKNVGGVREDIHIGNGDTYHQEAVKGKKSGIVYVPDRTYLCKDGHFRKAD
jgi:hypothetical protein